MCQVRAPSSDSLDRASRLIQLFNWVSFDVIIHFVHNVLLEATFLFNYHCVFLF